MPMSQIILSVPYSERKRAKQLKCRWNSKAKYWYIKTNDIVSEEIAKFADEYRSLITKNYTKFTGEPFVF